jgi:peptidoglycan biosynthesis protein MviN/MurJ (putative lipid II flippase)
LTRRGGFIRVLISAGGVSVIIQAFALLRQLLIAAWFGVSQQIDIYVMAYTFATLAVFTFANIFDSVAVPHLVRLREQSSLESAHALAGTIVRGSLVLGLVATVLLLVGTFLLGPVVATGFSSEERVELNWLIWSFAPWTLICLPYYAHVAWYKAQWRFKQAFAADVVVVLASIVLLMGWHGSIASIPLAYAGGYAAGLLQLAIGARLWRRGNDRPSSRAVFRNVGELYLANQSGGVASLVDRHVQSYVPAGGVGAINYAAQIVNTMASFLTFREIFIVPLAQKDDRDARLERLICGLVVISVPTAAAVICFAPEIVQVLLERGRFDQSAAALTSTVLEINALSLVLSAIGTPLFRMFQIVDRIHLTHVMYLTNAVSLAFFGYIFVGRLNLGVAGVAWMQVSSGLIGFALLARLIRFCGIQVHWWSVLPYFLLAVAAAGAAYCAGKFAASPFENSWARLVIGGLAFGLVVVWCYAFAYSRLHAIAFGTKITKSPSI